MMPKYQVLVNQEYRGHVTVEAANEEAAKEMANKVMEDDGDVEPEACSWEILDVREVA